MGPMGNQGDNFRVVAGRYRLEARLGRGGMGVVWRATDQLLGRRVAVKELVQDDTLTGEEARGRRDRTLREARAVAQLSHPHIIVVHDVVEEDDRPYIVMELIEGRSLRAVVQREAPLALPRALAIAAQVAASLADAHGHAIVHRDLKPDNVMLQDRGRERDVVRVLDFGIAKMKAGLADAPPAALTRTDSFLGSPIYMSPEQAKRARDVDSRSDVWSLCVSLYQALCGSCPWDPNASLAELLLAICTEPVPPLREAAPWVDPDLAAMAVSWDDDDRWIAVTRGSLRVVANLADAPREIDLDRPATGVLFSTGEAPGIDRETVTLPAETAVVLTT